MTDLDTRLRESLMAAGESFSPSRRQAAPERFVRARRRRVVLRSAGAVALVAILAVAAVIVLPTDDAIDDPPPVGPVPAPAPAGPIDISARIGVPPMPLDVTADGSNVYVGHAEVDIIDVVDPSTEDIAYRIGYAKSQGDQPAPKHLAIGPAGLYVGRRGMVELWDPDGGKLPLANTKANVESVGTISDLAYGDDFVWVAQECCGPPQKNSILQLAADDLSVVASYPGAGITMKSPTYPTIDFGYGALWVGTNGGETEGLVRIDPETQEMRTVPGIDSVSDVAVGAGGVWVYENALALTSDSPEQLRSRLLRIDPETLEVEEKATVLGYFAWLEADENGVWVLNASDETDRRLLRIDPVKGDSMGTSLRLGAGPFEMTSGFGSIWITDEGKGRVLRVDVAPET